MPHINKNLRRLRKDNPFSKLLRIYKNEHDLSNKEIAAKLNLHPSAVCRMINGDHIPIMNTFCQVIFKMGLGPRQMYYFVEEMSFYYEQYNGPSDKPYKLRNRERWVDAVLIPEPVPLSNNM